MESRDEVTAFILGVLNASTQEERCEDIQA